MAALHQITRPHPFQPIPTYREQNSRVALKLDLNSLYVKKPTETLFIKVNHSNLSAWGMGCGDLLIVENSEEYRVGDLLVIEQNGRYQFYHYLSMQHGKFGENEHILLPLDFNAPRLHISHWHSLNIVGVITNVIHQIRKPINPHALPIYQ